jgi:hypothetical protein
MVETTKSGSERTTKMTGGDLGVSPNYALHFWASASVSRHRLLHIAQAHP